MSPGIEESVRCSESGCSCVCFRPGSIQLRSCDLCGHGWVAHAMETLRARPPSSCGPVEVALPGPVFDLSSLVLYGAQAVPVQLKILLDRIYSILSPEQVGQILHALGWRLEDYVRGYMLQYPSGKVLDRWSMVSPEEELIILRQFLRFGETRPIVELMMLHCLDGDDQNSGPEAKAAVRNDQSNNKKNEGTQRDSRPVSQHNPVHHSKNVLGGPSLLFPFHFPHSDIPSLLPSTAELGPSSKRSQILQRSKLGRTRKDGDFTWKQIECEPAVPIKPDPDKSSPLLSLWIQSSGLHNQQDLLLQRGETRQEKPASCSCSSDSSLISSSSLMYPPISNSSSSHLQNSPKLQRSPSSLQPLPSFSSSFCCSLRTSSFTSPPLPSSLLTSPSLGGSRKGRVCCGVCGKSFYDKGTLKIHYNAVHLKIKHRCTIVGCTMVFSSLRSRNRHSANPNPRLHTGACRDAQLYRTTRGKIRIETPILRDRQDNKDKHGGQMCREGESSSMFWQHSDNTQPQLHANTMNSGHLNIQHGRGSHTPQKASSPSTPCHQTVEQNSSWVTSPINPQTPPLLLPTGTASSGDSPSCSSSLLTSQQRRWRLVDPLPKKKPRKSSTPMKIKRESFQSRRCEDNDDC